MRLKSQHYSSICFLCQKKSTLFLCSSCIKNPFLVEDAREKAARLTDPSHFISLYSKSLSEISNKNTKNFWDTHFEKELTLKDQDRMTREKIKKMATLLPTKKLRLLDIGFGQGYFEEQLESARKEYEITGIDISSEAVARAKRKFGGEFIHGDLHRIGTRFHKKSFDVIVAIEVIEHISPKNIFAFFKDVHGLLKAGGTLIISTPLNEHLRTLRKNPSGHVRDYRIAILRKELELSGFEISDVSTFYAFNKFYSLKKLLAKLLRNRWEVNNVVMKAVKK